MTTTDTARRWTIDLDRADQDRAPLGMTDEEWRNLFGTIATARAVGSSVGRTYAGGVTLTATRAADQPGAIYHVVALTPDVDDARDHAETSPGQSGYDAAYAARRDAEDDDQAVMDDPANAPAVVAYLLEMGSDYADQEPILRVATDHATARRLIAAEVHDFLVSIGAQGCDDPYAEQFLAEHGEPGSDPTVVAAWLDAFNMDDAPGTVLTFTEPVYGA